jgi:hypothetical protein
VGAAKSNHQGQRASRAEPPVHCGHELVCGFAEDPDRRDGSSGCSSPTDPFWRLVTINDPPADIPVSVCLRRSD